jgi:hypothetical protein
MVTLLPMVIPVCHATCVPPPELLLLPPELLEPLPPLLPPLPLLLAPELLPLPLLPPPLLVLPPPLPPLLPPAPPGPVSDEEQPVAAARTDAMATTKEERTCGFMRSKPTVHRPMRTPSATESGEISLA